MVLTRSRSSARVAIALKGRQERERLIAITSQRLASVLQDLAATAEGNLRSTRKAQRRLEDDPFTEADMRKLTQMLRSIEFTGAVSGAAEAAVQVGVSTLLPDAPPMQELLGILGDRIVGIDETTRSQVANHVATARGAGLSVEEIIAGDPTRNLPPLRQIGAFSERRARTIARTELTVAQNKGAVVQWRDSGVVDRVRILDGDGCGWLSHGDSDIAHGSIRTLDDFNDHPIAHPNCVRVPVPLFAEEPSAEAAPRITAAEQATVDYYKLGGYKDMNTVARGQITEKQRRDWPDATARFEAAAKKHIKNMDGAFKKSPGLPDDTVLYRGAGLETEYKVGQTITDKGFASSTSDRTLAAKFAKSNSIPGTKPTVLEIEAPKGTKVVAGNEIEKETILPRGSKFTVVATGTRGGIPYVRVRLE